jgi:hypothetical protein
MRSRPGIRFIPFIRFIPLHSRHPAVTRFGTLGGHATAFLTELAKQATASKGMHVGKLLAPGAERFLSPSMSLTRTTSSAVCPPPQTVWRPLLPRLGCLLLPRRSSPAPWAASVPVRPRAAREAPLVASTCCIIGVA